MQNKLDDILDSIDKYADEKYEDGFSDGTQEVAELVANEINSMRYLDKIYKARILNILKPYCIVRED